MEPDVRRQISEIRVSKNHIEVKFIDKMRALDLLSRTLQMGDRNAEETKCGSDGIHSIVWHHLSTATFAECVEFHKLLTTGQIFGPDCGYGDSTVLIGEIEWHHGTQMKTVT